MKFYFQNSAVFLRIPVISVTSKKCLPDAEFVFTSYMDEPLFVKEQPDLIYMGAMTESAQEKIIRKLMPYKARIAELIAADVPMLFTNNAVEILDSILRMKTVQDESAGFISDLCQKGYDASFQLPGERPF